jgi:RimJ/RimL family protein N-acetyltransferase
MNEIKEEPLPNWPGYEYPLVCRVIKETDAPILYPVMKKSANHLKGFIGWAKYASSWDISVVQQFVKDHANDEWPRFHLIFSIGYDVVGFGSLASMGNYRDIQVALWVAKGHDRRGIGSWIVQVLEWYAFNVFGYDNVYYQHDSSNRKSGSLAQRLGYKYSHCFDEKISAQDESGLWFSYKKIRPANLPPGVIDTGSFSNWEGLTLPWKSLI